MSYALDAATGRSKGRNIMWRPIDTAPKDGDEVWLYCPGDHPAQCAGFFSSDAGGRWEHCSKVLYDVAPEIFPTHWMPLPDAPKE